MACPERNCRRPLQNKRGFSEFILFIGRVDPEVVPMYSDIATAMIAPFADNPELELTIPAKISSCMASRNQYLL